MTGNRENAKEAGLKETVLYRETIPFGKIYHGVMGRVIFLLAAGLIIFWLTGPNAGSIALGVTIPFVGWAYLGCRKTDMNASTRVGPREMADMAWEVVILAP